MHLNELRIDDFGCFRGARISNLDENMVVIGGPQRAGKTTFMQALRQLPDGVDRSGDIPPATDEYRIDAEITHNEQRYRYFLTGHASPSVSPIDGGPEIDATDVFSPVTERQYRNLYTISLEELRRLPPEIDSPEDLARVLLGGAYGDIAEIPDLEGEFADRADEIGLTRGDPTTTTSKINDPYQTIREGIEARTEASQQVDEYTSVTDKLEEKRAEQSEIEDEIDRRQRIRDRLNILKELFEPLQERETLDAQLETVDSDGIDKFPTHLADRLEHFEEQFETATAELTDARQTFEQEATIDSTEEYYEWLLEHEAEIDEFVENQKLWDNTVQELTENRTALESKRNAIERKISTLHSEWDGSFTHIDEIETSKVDTAQVDDLVSTLERLQTERNELDASIESAETHKQELEARLAEMEEEFDETREIDVPKRQPAIVAGMAIVAGTAVGLAAASFVGVVGGLAGVITGFFILGVGLLTMDATVTVQTTVDAEPYREVKGQIATLEGDLKGESQRRSELKEQITDTQEQLSRLVTELGLPKALPPGEIPEFYEQVVERNDEIAAYRDEREEWESHKENLATDLDDVAALLEDVTEVSWTSEEPLEDANSLLTALENVATDLELAQDVQGAERERADYVADINSVLTEWNEDRSVTTDTDNDEIIRHVQEFYDEVERVSEIEDRVDRRNQLDTQISTRLENPSAREAFEPLREDNEPWADVVWNAATEFADTDAVADEIRDQNARIAELKDKHDELREDCVELEQKQEELSSEDDLREARAKIEEGRVEFERLGEAYAVNRIAESMVKQLHERLMEDVVHSLVDDASGIFSEITQEYDGITLEGEVQNLKFQALRDDRTDHGIGELSRATAEQLFLAVRLARIRQTDVSLPVVLDDAATNFDPNHMNRVFEVIDQLSNSNQVFFLTCHPQCVQLTASNTPSAQYWSLDRGQFTLKENAGDLGQQLSAD